MLSLNSAGGVSAQALRRTEQARDGDRGDSSVQAREEVLHRRRVEILCYQYEAAAHDLNLDNKFATAADEAPLMSWRRMVFNDLVLDVIVVHLESKQVRACSEMSNLNHELHGEVSFCPNGF